MDTIKFNTPAGNAFTLTPIADGKVRVESTKFATFETGFLCDTWHVDNKDHPEYRAVRALGCRGCLRDRFDDQQALIVPLPNGILDRVAVSLRSTVRLDSPTYTVLTDADLHDYYDFCERSARHFVTTTEEQALR